jgi:uncharacterized membrane protein/nitrite reductase/ring-hydroxylating ferredoxin subunit
MPNDGSRRDEFFRNHCAFRDFAVKCIYIRPIIYQTDCSQLKVGSLLLTKRPRMKSRANIKGHPIHPILITLPIGFFIGTLVFDLLGLAFMEVSFNVAAGYMEISGVIGGLLAAVPGFIDYLNTVPPKSSAKKRATQHGLLNVTMVLIFAAAWIYRMLEEQPEYIITIALEFIGVVLMSIAGWLGGTLVYRNQIGVDPRYAFAGKWKEKHFDHSEERLIEVAASDELKLNQMQLLHIDHRRIVLARTETGYVAFDDHCTHRGGSLAGGSMICGTVQCPWHGSQFDTTTGDVKAGPAKEKIETYEVIEKDGKIFFDKGLIKAEVTSE